MNNRDYKKIYILLLIILLIVLFGIGLYLFLTYAKNNVNAYKLEDKTLKLGEEPNLDINYYINNDENCTLDVSLVNKDEVGKYKYYVECGKKKLEATIEVIDKK